MILLWYILKWQLLLSFFFLFVINRPGLGDNDEPDVRPSHFISYVYWESDERPGTYTVYIQGTLVITIQYSQQIRAFLYLCTQTQMLCFLDSFYRCTVYFWHIHQRIFSIRFTDIHTMTLYNIRCIEEKAK